MPLTGGTKLGPYEIVGAIGAGGMGEVYRARDARLRRDVAIKVLPAGFSADADRLRRFEQEARAAAALNHPNILAVLDIGTDGDAPFIVSELLEGQTLRDRLRGGPVPVRKAIGYAIAIARGLSAAHEKGIVHRDLKPENLFITSDDRVKILDFGLAKLTDRDVPTGESTLQTAAVLTEPGLVLGTAGYMAPEQVRGSPVDHRVDLFAFGAILYELVSGRRAFRRDTAPETLSSILNDDPPPLESSERPIPPALVRIVDRCLEKNPAGRFQTATDLAFALEALSDSTGRMEPAGIARPPASRAGRWIPWVVAAALLLTLAPIAYQHARERTPAPVLPVRFRIPPGVPLSGPGNFSVSPDGRFLAFFGQGAGGTGALFVHAMDSLEARPIAGSEVPAGAPIPPPIWSPDGRFVVFQGSDSKLKRLDLSGGPPQTLCDFPGVAVGGSWSRAGDILVGNTSGPVLRVSETGGVTTPVTATPAGVEEFHLLPSLLPDGRHFVYLRILPGAPESSGVYVGSLDAKPGEQNGGRLMPYQVGISYAPARDGGPGHLLFLREGTVIAQPFDERRLALTGNALPVVDHVGSFRDGAFFSNSANDVLVYRTADADYQLAIFDRSGTVSARVSEPGGFRTAALSPRGDRAVVSRTNAQDAAGADLWLYDLSRRVGATRLTFGALAEYPLWSPDGQRIAYTLNNNTLYQKLASGEGDEKEIVRRASVTIVKANSWSPDGRFLLYSSTESLTTLSDLLVLPAAGGKPVPFLQTKFAEDQGRFSPDGKWVAYVSDQSGTTEVYVRPFASDVGTSVASAGGSVLVSRSGGTAPRWRGDGKELFYLALDGKMMAVDVTTTPEFRAGAPASLFQTAPGTVVGDVSPDGKQFFLVVPAGPSASAPFTVVLNWTGALKQ